MTHRTRRRLAILVLVVGLPVYVALALYLVSLFERPGALVEVGIYVALGVLWALPLRGLFRGVARPDPDGRAPDQPSR